MERVETFEDIENPALQAYNRLMVSMNLNDKLGSKTVSKYLEQFNEADRFKIFAIGAAVRQQGKRAVQKQLGII